MIRRIFAWIAVVLLVFTAIIVGSLSSAGEPGDIIPLCLDEDVPASSTCRWTTARMPG